MENKKKNLLFGNKFCIRHVTVNRITEVFPIVLGQLLWKPKSLAAQVIFSPLFLIVLDFRGEGTIRCLQVGATEAKTMNI